MGGQTEPIGAQLRESYRDGMDLREAVGVAVRGLQSAPPPGGAASAGGNAGGRRVLGVNALEVAVLDRGRPRRAFRRLTGATLTGLLPEENRDKAGRESEGDEPVGGGNGS
jgi:proteasome alpha subunit